MASSGIRLGAWDYLKWEQIKPIIRNEQGVAARITVYAGENEQYYSYITRGTQSITGMDGLPDAGR